MMWNEVMYYYTWKYSHQYHCTITHSPTQVHSETHTHTHTFQWIKTKKRKYLFPYACMVMLNNVTSHNIKYNSTKYQAHDAKNLLQYNGDTFFGHKSLFLII